MCVFVCVCVYLGSISSLMQISLNIIDILCLHIFFWICSNSRLTFIVFGGIDLGIVHSCMYIVVFTELHLKANAIIFNGKDVLTQ